MKNTLASLLLLAACTKPAAAPPAPPPPAPAVVAAPVVDDCTLETVLKPGIPGSPGHLIPSDINPNGASELATLMRTFVADWKDTKAKLEAGQPVTAKLPVHRRIRCSWPTAKEDRDAKFDGLAVAYLAHVKAFDAAPSRESYGNVISACAACHEATCGGPLDLINSLRFPSEDAGGAK